MIMNDAYFNVQSYRNSVKVSNQLLNMFYRLQPQSAAQERFAGENHRNVHFQLADRDFRGQVIQPVGAEDRRDIKKLKTGGTTSSRGHTELQASEDRRDSKQQRTGGTSRS